MSQETTTPPIDWNEVRRLARESIAMGELILRAVSNSSAMPTMSRTQYALPQIIDIVAQWFRLSKSKMISQDRQADIVWPRQVACFFCRELTDASLAQIGEQLGQRNHGTVINSVKVVANRIETETTTREDIANLRNYIIANLK